MKGPAEKLYLMRSYTLRGGKIHPVVATALILSICLAGCAQVTVPTGSNNVDTPTVLTGSIPTPSDQAYSDVNADDRAVIAENLDTLSGDLDLSEESKDVMLSWLNPVSGNSGTLTKIETATFDATGCLSFHTTANTIAGIKLYSGTACRDVTQRFAVTALSVTDT